MSNHSSKAVHLIPGAPKVALAAFFCGALFLAACGGGADENSSGDRHWSEAALLEEADGFVQRPKVVVDADDDVTVVWSQMDGASHRIYGRGYSAAGTLGPVVAVSESGVDAQGHDVGIDGDGDVFAVWSQYDVGGTMSVQWSAYSAATGLWSAPAALVTGVTNAWDVRIAVDASGTATAIWIQRDSGYNEDIYACRFTATATGAPAPLAHVAANGTMGSAQVAAGPGGTAMAVWRSREEGSTIQHVWARYFNGSSWGAAQGDAGLGDAGDPSVAFDASGNAMVVWTERTGDENATTPYLMRSRRFVAGTGWAADYETLPNSDVGFNEDPSVAFDSAGPVLLWGVDLGATVRLRFSRYTAGSGWGAPVSIDQGTGVNFSPEMTIDGNDNITVTWQRTTDYATWTLSANRYEPAAGWRGATDISIGEEYFVGVSIASDSRDRAIAVWGREHSGGTNADGWFSVYQ